jgi:hypothetical protein
METLVSYVATTPHEMTPSHTWPCPATFTNRSRPNPSHGRPRPSHDRPQPRGGRTQPHSGRPRHDTPVRTHTMTHQFWCLVVNLFGKKLERPGPIIGISKDVVGSSKVLSARISRSPAVAPSPPTHLTLRHHALYAHILHSVTRPLLPHLTLRATRLPLYGIKGTPSVSRGTPD